MEPITDEQWREITEQVIKFNNLMYYLQHKEEMGWTKEESLKTYLPELSPSL